MAKVVHFVTNNNLGFKECFKCGNELAYVQVKYCSSSGNSKKCFVKKCEKCGINYIDTKLYESISENGKNPNVECEPLIKTAVHKKTIVKAKKKKVAKLEEVMVYKKSNSCIEHHSNMVKTISLKLKNPLTKEEIVIQGYCCEKCGNNFIFSEEIKEYTTDFFIPYFKCILPSSMGTTQKDESLLSIYGYTVSDGILSKEQRRYIIRFVINHDIMTAEEVKNLLKYNITLRESIPAMKNACLKWQHDLDYIKEKYEL